MAIFSRRALQRILNENATFLSADQILSHINGLNNPSVNTLALEWEITTLNALSRFGTLTHEPNLGGPKRLDVLFRPFEGKQTTVIEITTVSDKGLDKENPIEALNDHLRQSVKKLRKRGINGGFSIQVGAVSLRQFRGSGPTRLKLPRVGRFEQVIFNEDFSRFLAAIIKHPQVSNCFTVRNDEADVAISYDPKGGFSGWGHPSYTAVHSKKRNPVANALEAKAEQLKKSGFSGPLGIVLCDGGCEMLGPRMHDWSSFALSEVIQDFLGKHPYIAFVNVIRVRQSGQHVGPNNLAIEGQVYRNHSAPELDQFLIHSLEKLHLVFPRPMKSSKNARYHLDWLRRTNAWNTGDSLIGGLTMSDRTVKISSRTILELLAGRLDPTVFFKAYEFEKFNPFSQQMSEGRLIADVRVEKSKVAEDDDEWLIFEFGEADPAISAFKSPVKRMVP